MFIFLIEFGQEIYDPHGVMPASQSLPSFQTQLFKEHLSRCFSGDLPLYYTP